MTVSIAALPGNQSRTSTQAISVPNTVDERRPPRGSTVSFSADQASGVVMASQKLLQPSSNARTARRAASGIRTTRLR